MNTISEMPQTATSSWSVWGTRCLSTASGRLRGVELVDLVGVRLPFHGGVDAPELMPAPPEDDRRLVADDLLGLRVERLSLIVFEDRATVEDQLVKLGVLPVGERA